MKPFKEFPNNRKETQSFIQNLIKRPPVEKDFEKSLLDFFKILSKEQIKRILTSEDDKDIEDHNLRIYKYKNLGDGLFPSSQYLIGHRQDYQWLSMELGTCRNMIIKDEQFVPVSLLRGRNAFGTKFLLLDALDCLDIEDGSILMLVYRLLEKFDQKEFNFVYDEILKYDLTPDKIKSDSEEYDPHWLSAGMTTDTFSKRRFGDLLFANSKEAKENTAKNDRVNWLIKEYPKVFEWDKKTPKKFRVNLKELYLAIKFDRTYSAHEECLLNVQENKLIKR